jgi:hypothetical protein
MAIYYCLVTINFVARRSSIMQVNIFPYNEFFLYLHFFRCNFFWVAKKSHQKKASQFEYNSHLDQALLCELAIAPII